MGFFNRIFGSNKPATASVAPTPRKPDIPPEKVGPDGDFDESGLAKRVAIAFDDDAQLGDLERLWIAQLGSQVVLKGEVPSQDMLDQAVKLAKTVRGASDVDASQVKVG
jgi:osmotically-inducible protein OsmY